jgi:hypothetical protein
MVGLLCGLTYGSRSGFWADIGWNQLGVPEQRRLSALLGSSGAKGNPAGASHSGAGRLKQERLSPPRFPPHAAAKLAEKIGRLVEAHPFASTRCLLAGCQRSTARARRFGPSRLVVHRVSQPPDPSLRILPACTEGTISAKPRCGNRK